MKKQLLFLSAVLVLSCNTTKQVKEETKPVLTAVSVSKPIYGIPKLDLKAANTLVELPLHCLNIEYPNRLSQTLGGDADLKSPSTLHPAFYGCFDWHSSVHGHWSMVSLLKQFPGLAKAEDVKLRLIENITKENIEKEIAYFKGEHNKSFERTYGWAWLLKLAEELHTWNTPIGKALESNLQPLTNLIIEKYIEFLPKLNYSLRVGTHSNTAFGLSFAYDYAVTVNNEALKEAIKTRAEYFFLNDKDGPMRWEPNGSDFLSPCLEEAALMKRLLSKEVFRTWLDAFLPQLKNKDYRLEVGLVSDRTDGQLVHLDGVNFSRAWCLNKIADGLPEYTHLKFIANHHINYSLPSIVGDSYEGGHWLASFAIYALNSTSE